VDDVGNPESQQLVGRPGASCAHSDIVVDGPATFRRRSGILAGPA
jgi:hypothetical protein